METTRQCTISDCSRKLYAKGLCNMHWQRMRLHGDPHHTGKRTPMERFWSKVEKTATCWIWTAAKTPAGYGILNIRKVATYAHRIAYENANGATAKGMYIDHICHNPSCVRPDHLRLVTNKQNAENHSGLMVTNTSGVRGVYWSKQDARWKTGVNHNGVRYSAGSFKDISEAEAAVIALRNRLFTHNDIDRMELVSN